MNMYYDYADVPLVGFPESALEIYANTKTIST
jgi:hypothetical protein